VCASTWVRIGLASLTRLNYFIHYLIKACATYAFIFYWCVVYYEKAYNLVVDCIFVHVQCLIFTFA